MLDEMTNIVSFVILCGFAWMAVDYIINDRFLPLGFSKWLVKFTPISVLYEKDMVVLDKARSELLRIANVNTFQDYLVYAKINPSIRSKSCLRVMVAQRKGKLEEWISKPEHLKCLADLVYQIHLVECFIHEDCDRF